MTQATDHADAALSPGSQVSTVRRSQTRERLFAAAIEVFAERGVIGASVEAICEQAGFTRGAFYSNFTDKDDLVLGILRHEAEHDYETVEQIMSDLVAGHDHKQPSELVAEAVPRLFADTTRDMVLAQEEMDLYAARQPQLRDAYRAFADQQREWFTTLVKQALNAVDLEFVIGFDEAITVLQDCCCRLQVTALLRDEAPDTGPIESLILAITRPRGDSTAP